MATISNKVVNCFRFVSLKDWTQLVITAHGSGLSCELLSICIFERLNTAPNELWVYLEVLWIAFDLYLWKIEHSRYKRWMLRFWVVNCFRFVSLKDWTQQEKGKGKGKISCELLSICIFERLNTALTLLQFYKVWLWIAFDLYLWKIEHSYLHGLLNGLAVVNCFRFVSLKDWTQHCHITVFVFLSCELLSICIFERLNTAGGILTRNGQPLWIAFDLYLWKIEHSKSEQGDDGWIVVNCFRFVSLKDWTQHRKYKPALA